MDNTMNNSTIRKEENLVNGIIGAVLGALAGGLVWVIFYTLGYVSFWSGFLGAFCAIKCYKKFAGTLSVKGIVIAIVATALILVIAWYISLGITFHKEFTEYVKQDRLDEVPSMSQCFEFVNMNFKNNSEFTSAALGDLGLGLLFAAIGVFVISKSELNKVKMEKIKAETAEKEQAEGEQNTATDSTPADPTL